MKQLILFLIFERIFDIFAIHVKFKCGKIPFLQILLRQGERQITYLDAIFFETQWIKTDLPLVFLARHIPGTHSQILILLQYVEDWLVIRIKRVILRHLMTLTSSRTVYAIWTELFHREFFASALQEALPADEPVFAAFVCVKVVLFIHHAHTERAEKCL